MRPHSRSAFAAAFLSLLFPGIGHAYAGAGARAVAFAAVPILSLALLLGIVLRIDRLELLGFVIQPWVLNAILVLNVVLALYRAVAAVDAWRVARFLNAVDASGNGRLGRARLPLAPLSVAGLAAVLLVLGAGHLAVARYTLLARDAVQCVFTDEDSADCELVEPPAPSPSGLGTPEPTDVPSDAPSEPPTPAPTGGPTIPPATLPPWDGKERLNILLVGTDERPREGSFNTDTMIVVSIDPESRRVAMFQLPRDTVDVPVPPGPARSLWGSVYRGKINSWYTQNRNRSDLWPGASQRARGYNALKAILGELYGLDIRWYVEVNFTGFQQVVDTLGGVNINVQIPVSDDRFPAQNGHLVRVYVPAGPQHMTGAEALRYARSRHTSSDFDRGRRQQRVLLSLREQADVGLIFQRLPELVSTLSKSVKTDIPTDQLPKLLALSDEIDTRDVRSYVFAPSFYAVEYLSSPRGYIITPRVDRIRAAVKNAFKADPELEAIRERLSAEGAHVWVLNQSGKVGIATGIAGYLDYYGMSASAPNQRPDGTLDATQIVVYNGAEARLPDTVAYLEALFGVPAVTRSDPGVTVDVIVRAGRTTKSLEAPSAG